MSDVRTELREQFVEAFESADYPVSGPMDLVPALPQGPGTRFEAGDGEFSMTAMEMATTLSGHQTFPYDSVEALVDDVMAALDAEDRI